MMMMMISSIVIVVIALEMLARNNNLIDQLQDDNGIKLIESRFSSARLGSAPLIDRLRGRRSPFSGGERLWPGEGKLPNQLAAR